MRNIGIALVLLAVIVSGLVGYYLSGSGDQQEYDDPSPVAIGMSAPDFTLHDKAGNAYTLSALRGNVVLVNFWATWCPPCRSEMPSMDQLYGNFGQGALELLAINVEPDGPEIIDEFMQENPHSFPVLFDLEGDVQEKYQVYRFPETFIVDKKGIIVDRVVGAIDWTDPKMLTYLNTLMRE